MTQSPARPRSATWRIRTREQRTILVIGDLCVSILALFGGLYFWGQKDAWLKFSMDFLRNRVETWFYLLPIFWIILLVELYDPHRAKNLRKTITGIALATLVALSIYSLVYLFSAQGSLPRLGIGIFLGFAFFLTLSWRLVYIQIFTAQANLRRVLIIGAGEAGETLARVYTGLHPKPFLLIGYMDDNPKKVGKKLLGFPILAGNDHLLEFVEAKGITDIVNAISGEMLGSTFQAILDAQEKGVDVIPMPSLYEELLGRVPIHHLESDWLIRSFVDQASASGFYEAGKRLLDILFGLIGLGFFIVIYPFIALITIIESGRPVLYEQIRSGKGGKPFKVFKFRTMRQDAEKDGKAQLTQEKDTRITRFGNFMRRTHIDEFPQFWNAVRGEMSLVGPRSERPEWIAEFQKKIPFYRARLLVKPGITGWAQVNYSYYATIEEMAIKLEYDLYYIKHRNLIMDVSIIIRTISQVARLRGR
jgi:exopolysaccharide biosynthesis polyprenyl glycosylphosphotransferase